MTALVYHGKTNDAIKGDKIILEAQSIKEISDVEWKKTQRAEGTGQARAWVDIDLYPVGVFHADWFSRLRRTESR